MGVCLPQFREKEEIFQDGNFAWQETELSELFHLAICKPREQGLEIFVDDLDECHDEEVRRVVKRFEKSADEAAANGTGVKICWSSRHYPYISAKYSLEIRMEDENSRDIARNMCRRSFISQRNISRRNSETT